MENSGFKEIPQFKNPEEEIVFLRQQIAEKEKNLENLSQEVDKEKITGEIINEYSSTEIKNHHQFAEKEIDKIVLDLTPEEHDKKMEELLGILVEKGIDNSLQIVQKMNNPHIDDDFHRFLIQYLISQKDIEELKKKNPLLKALHMKLYEITLPEEFDEQKDFKGLIASMEQFYAGMMSVSDGQEDLANKNYFTIEIALSNEGEEVIFYAAVPRDKSDLFEKHILAVYPNAKVIENKNDYNIFNEEGFSSGAYGLASNNPIFPIKTYDQFEHDPLDILISVFGKLKKTGEGASVQFVISPVGDSFVKKYGFALDRIKQGVSVKDAINLPDSFMGSLGKSAKEMFFGVGLKEKNEEKHEPFEQEIVANITKKIDSTILNTNIRIITSAETEKRSEEILNDLSSAFNQFNEVQSNGIVFEKVKGKKLLDLFHKFSYRLLFREHSLPLSIKELTTILHFPTQTTQGHQLKQEKSNSAPVPLNISQEGVILGINKYRHMESEVRISNEDRMRHLYVIGQTGTGKTTLLKNMINQDIKNGHGVCMIDPHGSDLEDILANIPQERIDDVVYFDPAHTERPMGLNMLEYDTRFPEQKAFVVNELLSIFNKLFDMKTTGGPMFEQYFRNATMLVIEDPESGNTLLDVSRVLSDASFRELKLSKCHNPVVLQFWREVAGKAGGEASLANIVPYITSKFDAFLSDEIMRPIIAQEKSAFNFRKIMDEKKILLVNLSKGRLGDINSSLIGLILVGKILMAALSRVDNMGGKLNDFFLYIDEFQNVTTPSIATILSEARKYRLGLNIAHQFIAQIDEQIKDAVFGNVGSIISFRVGTDDAKYLESQFEPIFTASDIMNLDNHNAYVNLLVNGQTAKPFNIETLAPSEGNPEIIDKIKQLSYLRYGRPKHEVEEEIMIKYTKKDPT